MATVMAPDRRPGGLGAVGGLFTMTANVAKASAEFQKLAKVTIGAGGARSVQFFAKMSEVSSETLGNPLCPAQSQSRRGLPAAKKQRRCQALCGPWHQPADGNGQVKKMADLLPDIFEAFRVNNSSTSCHYWQHALRQELEGRLSCSLKTSRESLTRWGAGVARTQMDAATGHARGPVGLSP